MNSLSVSCYTSKRSRRTTPGGLEPTSRQSSGSSHMSICCLPTHSHSRWTSTKPTEFMGTSSREKWTGSKASWKCHRTLAESSAHLCSSSMGSSSPKYHAWVPGQISFGLIQTAINNQVRKHLPAEEWKLVCEGMCHDFATGDRFYTTVPDIQDVFHVQDLCMKAMEQDSQELSNQSSESEDGLPSTGDNSTET
ncbi:hypothetical protein SRHO_G00179180 [Serrasalmus rhombeus]